MENQTSPLLSAESPACVRCGACQAVCPLYQLVGRETVVARGKLNLWERYGANEGSARLLQEVLECCLLCGACADKCAVGLEVPRLVKEARAALTARQGRPFSPAWLMARLTWQAPELTAAASHVAPFLNRLKALAGQESGLMARLWPQLAGAAAKLPDLAATPFLKLVPPALPGRGGKRIAFFAGCGVNALFPQAGLAFLRICEHLGLEVMIPPRQGCCGLLAGSVGEAAVSRDLARRFLQDFHDLPVDFVVTACASCASQLKNLGEVLAGGEEAEAAARLAGKVREAAEFLVREADYRPAPRPLPAPAGFHHPCHLHREQKVLEEPRLLLTAATGEAPLEPRTLACCGMGGAFGVMQPALSRAVAEVRLGEFRELGAGLLTTACSGCLAQFQAHAEGLDVRHFLELVAPAMEKG